MFNSILLSCMLSATSIQIDGGGKMITGESIEEPISISVGDIEDSMVSEFVSQMEAAQKTGQSVVPIYISSYGGSVHALIEMIDAIKRSKIPVATIATGKAMSAGAVLLAMGTNGYRYSSKNTSIMIHEVSSGTRGKTSDIVSDAAEIKRLNALMFKLMAENIGKPDNYFIELISDKDRVDWYLLADEALTLGIINKIGVPELKIKVKVQTLLE